MQGQDLANLYAGKLLLRSEIPLDEPTFQNLLTEQKFRSTPSLSSNFLITQCQRCGNKKNHLFGKIPCRSCYHTHRYCRNCIEMGRVMACQPLYSWTGPRPQWNKQETPCHWKGELTAIQQKASDRIVTAILGREEELLVWAVCGAGKTEMLFAGIAQALKTGQRVCLATPRADVVRELLPRFENAFPNTSIVALYGGSPNNHATGQLTLSTTHQLLRYQRAFDIMIIDEIDAFPYHADSRLPFVTNRSVKPTATKIYLTATPRNTLKKRSQKGHLPTLFVPIRYHGHPLPVPQLKLTFNLAKTLTRAKLPNTFWQWYKNHRQNHDRQLLIFTATITQAESLLPSLQAMIPTKQITAVHAKDPNRIEKVTQFRNKKLDILLTTTILERGVTFPSVDVVILDAGHDVFDQAAIVQIAGRAGRSPDDPTGEVLLIHDGKTEAMLDAIRSIKTMNKRASQHHLNERM